jgi:RHS repeat-associated protein
VYTWNTSTSAFNTTPAAKVGFLYHDWNLLQEVNLAGSSPATLRSYYWGLDMSGTFQGAGGVGGLLASGLNHTLTTYDSAFYVADANGNVSDLAWSYGGFAAHYEYDAFGNAFPEGQLATANPFRFSTKYTETDAATGGNETGLLYYGFRYYNPSTGRWPSRDPIGERGGNNLYGMVGNDTINWADVLGMRPCKWTIRAAHGTGGPHPDLVPDSNKTHLNNIDNGNSLPPCDRVSVVGCHMNEQNAGIAPGRGIPNQPRVPQDEEGEIDSDGLPDAIDSSYNNARAEAEKGCGDKCCDTITIVMVCKQGTENYDKKSHREYLKWRGTHPNLDQEPKCGKQVTYNCKTGAWE